MQLKAISMVSNFYLQKWASECLFSTQSRKKMGNFYEAFGVINIEAPSTTRKRINKKSAQPKRSSRPRPFVKRPRTEAKPSPK